MSSVRFATLALFIMSVVIMVFTVAPGLAQSPMPDGVRFADQPVFIQVGQNYTIALQVTIGGGDFARGSIGIILTSNNSSVIDLPEGARTVTNRSGIALYNITADKINPGKTTLTAYMLDGESGINATKKYIIALPGDINGMVKDSTGAPVSGANVTLYTSDSNGKLIYPGGVTTTADNNTSKPGSFTFSGIPYDRYYIVATVNNNSTGINYTLEAGALPVDLVIGANTTNATSQPSTSAGVKVNTTPSTSQIVTVPTSPSTTDTTTASPVDGTKLVTWISLLALAFSIVILTVVLWVRKR